MNPPKWPNLQSFVSPKMLDQSLSQDQLWHLTFIAQFSGRLRYSRYELGMRIETLTALFNEGDCFFESFRHFISNHHHRQASSAWIERDVVEIWKCRFGDERWEMGDGRWAWTYRQKLETVTASHKDKLLFALITPILKLWVIVTFYESKKKNQFIDPWNHPSAHFIQFFKQLFGSFDPKWVFGI